MLIVLGAGPATEFWSRLVMNLAILLVALIIGAVVVMLIKRRLAADQKGESPGFTLQELRQMKARGDLSDEEYEAARALILGQFATAESADSAADDGSEEVPPERRDDASQGGEDGDSRGR